MNENITLSVVMPAYNEGQHIYDNLVETDKILSTFVRRYEIIAVNDGSKDNTWDEIKRAASKLASVSDYGYSDNQGKGYAICHGIENASGRYIAFLDSDLELSPKMLKSFLKIMKEQDVDIVIGSKLHKDSKLDYPFIRKIMSYGYYLMLKVLFRLNVHDTQTGIKLFKNSVIKPITGTLDTAGYAFDIEILAKANKKGFRIAEAPITLNYSRDDAGDGRRIKLADIFQVFKDTINIKKKLKSYN